ncbi:MAG: GAF domain-containing protein [Gemmatimonadaceae bacterium]|jgi:GAF domain-containing protein|nr:GAF domain-containing protein [Gemmatimonadaceae bacterium]
MEPVIPDLRGAPRREAYRDLVAMQHVLLAGHDDVIAGMATTSALVHHAFGHLWTGFYRVVTPGALLRVGPYQGTLGCLDIAFGRGVCGTAAAERRTVIVPDVHAFPGHIACDGRARSEIVLPVIDARGELLAVFDVDSEQVATFDEEDATGLAALLDWFGAERRVDGASLAADMAG